MKILTLFFAGLFLVGCQNSSVKNTTELEQTILELQRQVEELKNQDSEVKSEPKTIEPKVSCPRNSVKENDQCVCVYGYTFTPNRKFCVQVPANAYATPSSATDAWKCKEGYREVEEKCVLDKKIEAVPQESFVEKTEKIIPKEQKISQEPEIIKIERDIYIKALDCYKDQDLNRLYERESDQHYYYKCDFEAVFYNPEKTLVIDLNESAVEYSDRGVDKSSFARQTRFEQFNPDSFISGKDGEVKRFSMRFYFFYHTLLRNFHLKVKYAGDSVGNYSIPTTENFFTLERR